MLLKTKDIAERIRAFRKELGLTRKGFSEKFGISEPTLRSWEIGLVKNIQIQNVETLIDNINAQGFQLNKEVLIYGKEAFLRPQEFVMHTKELLHKVINNMNAPVLETGDMLIGQKPLLPFEDLHNRLCIVQSDGQHVGIIHCNNKNEILLKTLFGETFMTFKDQRDVLFFVVSCFVKNIDNIRYKKAGKSLSE